MWTKWPSRTLAITTCAGGELRNGEQSIEIGRFLIVYFVQTSSVDYSPREAFKNRMWQARVEDEWRDESIGHLQKSPMARSIRWR